MTDVKPIPDGYPQITPYLCVDDAEAAISFYSEVFGARERMRLPMPDGGIGHAELEVGDDGLIMLSSEAPEMGVRAPQSIGGSPVMISIYVEDVDAVFAKALEAGATQTRAPEDQFYGDRSGQFEDPFGHRWGVATHVEDISAEEMSERAAEAFED
jgi:PhnB protein